MSDFKSTDTNSISDSSLATTDSEPTRAREPVSVLIPPFLREVCLHPKHTEIRVSYDAPTLQTNYTFSITWDGDLETEGKVEDLISAGTSSTSVAALTGGLVPPVEAKCDGPCKRAYNSNLLNSIGRCGHYLCNACFGIVTNNDGTNGCSSIACNWKGNSRDETKKFYEKVICRKQRERARDMITRGIDVKVASAASSISDISSHGSWKSETDLSSLASTIPAPSTGTKQKTVLVILEASKHGAMDKTTSTKNLPPTFNILKVLSKLAKQKKSEDHSRGTLYYVQERPDKERELHLIDKRDFENLCLYHFPKVNNEVIFVLDLNEFVQNGCEIQI